MPGWEVMFGKASLTDMVECSGCCSCSRRCSQNKK